MEVDGLDKLVVAGELVVMDVLVILSLEDSEVIDGIDAMLSSLLSKHFALSNLRFNGVVEILSVPGFSFGSGCERCGGTCALSLLPNLSAGA